MLLLLPLGRPRRPILLMNNRRIPLRQPAACEFHQTVLTVTSRIHSSFFFGLPLRHDRGGQADRALDRYPQCRDRTFSFSTIVSSSNQRPKGRMGFPSRAPPPKTPRDHDPMAMAVPRPFFFFFAAARAFANRNPARAVDPADWRNDAA